MGDVAALFGLGVFITVLLVLIRGKYPEMAVLISLAFVLVVFARYLDSLREVIRIFFELATRAEIQTSYLDVVVKTIGIAYVAAFGAQLSRDAKEETIAFAIEFAGKIIILLLGLPVLVAIVKTLVSLLP